MTQTVLILGASGKIGRHSARAFENAGWTVRKFNRTTDTMTEAAKGCDVIVNGMNPPNYHDWAGIIPTITRDVISAARQAGATVIIPGNVYHFGAKGGVWSEQTPANPNSRKGVIRTEMEATYRDSGVQTIVLRAGNFIDPDDDGCVMSMVYLRALDQGKITLPGPATTTQAMCYLPDWARACVALAEKRDDLGRFEDIPFAGHTVCAADIKTEAEQITGRTLRYSNFPWFLFAITAPFWELAREMREMRYLWNTNHALSEHRLRDILPDFQSTPFKQVMAAKIRSDLSQ